MYSGTANEYTYRQQARNILDIIVVSNRCDLVPVHPSDCTNPGLTNVGQYSNNIFFQTQPKSDVFPCKCSRSTFVMIRRLSQSDVCTSPMFVSVRLLSQSDVCTSPTFVSVRRLYHPNVCLSPTFVSVRRLYQSDACTSPTFGSPTFVASDVCVSDVCTGTFNLEPTFTH